MAAPNCVEKVAPSTAPLAGVARTSPGPPLAAPAAPRRAAAAASRETDAASEGRVPSRVPPRVPIVATPRGVDSPPWCCEKRGAIGSDAPCHAVSTSASTNSQRIRSSSHRGARYDASVSATAKTTRAALASQPPAMDAPDDPEAPDPAGEAPVGSAASAAQSRRPRCPAAETSSSSSSSSSSSRRPRPSTSPRPAAERDPARVPGFPGRRSCQCASADAFPAFRALASGARTAGCSASRADPRSASPAHSSACASRTSASAAVPIAFSIAAAASRHASSSTFRPFGHLAASAFSPGRTPASVRRSSARNCASLAARSAGIRGSVASAKSAPSAGDAAATRAAAASATNLGSPCILGASACSDASKDPPSARPGSRAMNPGSLRAMRSAATTNASAGPRSWSLRRRLRSARAHRGSAAAPGVVSSSPSSPAPVASPGTPPPSSSPGNPSPSRSARSARARACARATPRSDAAAACSGLPEEDPGAITHVDTTPAHRNATSPNDAASSPKLNPGLTPGSRAWYTRGADPPRSKAPLTASAPTI